MKTIYIVSRNADESEGRGPMIPVAAFDNRTWAQVASQGIFGGRVEEIILYQSIDEWHNKETQDLRQKALAKLSQAEQIALGI